MEELTYSELSILAVSLNAKIRELQIGLDMLELDDSSVKKSYEQELEKTKELQEKLFRMCKNQSGR